MNDRHNKIGATSQRLTDALGIFHYGEGVWQTPIQRVVEEVVTDGRGFKPEENLEHYMSGEDALHMQLRAMNARDGKHSSSSQDNSTTDYDGPQWISFLTQPRYADQRIYAPCKKENE